MFYIMVASVLAVSAASVIDAEDNRVAYNNCLVDFTIEHLALGTGVSAFRNAAQNACATEKSALISAIKKDELQFGSSEKDATEYATEEAEGVLFSYTDGYSGYKNSNTKPMK